VCNNAVISGDTLHGQPTEGAILAAGMKIGLYNATEKYIRLQEYPFSSETKVMAVKCIPANSPNEERSEIYFVKGAMEKLLHQCRLVENISLLELLLSFN
jgi:P-type Ca2+ transporter type 2C